MGSLTFFQRLTLVLQTDKHMDTTRLSSKGQIIIPKEVRRRRQWKPGQEFDILETEDGVLLRPHRTFQRTRIEDVGATLQYDGPPVPVKQLSIGVLPYPEPYEDEPADDGT